LDISKSIRLKNQARKIIPSQTGTFSRAASSFVEGVYPVYVDHASGSRFTDVDGNSFLDYSCALGPITLGYNYSAVNNAIIDQLKKGILFSLPHPVEIKLSEIISEIIPHAEMVKFEKSGSNAVTGAVRVARYITKREKIAYCGSGGVWHDWQAAMVSRDGGVPEFNKELIKIFDYNDPDGLEQIFEDNPNEIAAVVLEPTVYEKPTKDFLQKVRKITDTNNSLLILDEIVTGFRFDLMGAQKFFDLKGDLVCFGKGMGNGLPISAITGREEFMKYFDDLWVSSTNNSETLALAGSVAVINEMRQKSTIPACWDVGKKLFDEWNKTTEKNNLNAKLTGYPVRMKMSCFNSKNKISASLKALIMQEMVKKGIFIPQSTIFLSYSHTIEDVNYTIESLDTVCKEINQKISNDDFDKFLEGTMPLQIWDMKIPSTKDRSESRQGSTKE